jgi:hypothetical protein
MEHIVKILEVNNVTHDVKRFVTTKPEGYSYTPGQATVVSLNKPDLKEARRPFTFTSLNEEPNLEFIIKIYEQKHGVTDAMDELKKGDELIINQPWGAIQYKGPGYFIAGGAGITPFIAILRNLRNENKLNGNVLLFSNKKEEDVILKKELDEMLGENVIYTLTREEKEGFESGRINKEFLKKYIKDFDKHFYVCGTPEMTEEINATLSEMGVSSDSLVFEG